MSLLDVLSSSGTSPTRQASHHEAAEVLARAIGTLPPVYQTVVRMYDLQGLVAKEVGEGIGRSPGAVYMLRARAHDRLREALGSEANFFSDSP
jgi:RNA polymerase sigma factor (sigma-70 family)